MKFRFEAVVEVPDGTPFADVEKWLRFEIGATSSLDGDNALIHKDLHSIGVTQFHLWDAK